MIKYHIERIKCPHCGKIQPAKVIHAFPFNIYSHCCKKCGYIIMESEWNKTDERIIERVKRWQEN